MAAGPPLRRQTQHENGCSRSRFGDLGDRRRPAGHPSRLFVSQRDLDRWLLACYVVRTMPSGNGGSSSQGEASAPNTPPQASLIALAAAFGTSQLTAITTFLAAIGAAYLGFRKLQTALGLSVPQCAALVGALLLLLLFTHTLPTVLEKRRKDRLASITGATRPGYFQLSARDDEESFQRADGKHDEVLKWLRHLPSRVLYLTGSSGTGKSSLLTAWVLPKLEREGVRIIRLRGYQDPAQMLEDELKRPGVIWKRNPPESSDLAPLFEQAVERLRPARILVVFDQFEEFLILQGEQQRRRFVEFLATQAGSRDSASGILLVFRAEYDGFIQELDLPAPIYGQNLQKVSAFTQRAAQEFFAASGLKIQDRLLADVLREAAEVEETPGMIRPVTLNLCGLVLARFSTGLPRPFRPGRLIRGFVHEAIFDPALGEASPTLLRRLISHQMTKKPCTIDELSQSTTFTPRQAQGVMFKLSEPERGIVHALDPDRKVWEISHDFLVAMIDSMLAGRRVAFWRRVRPWLPAAYVAILIASIAALSLARNPIEELTRLRWQIDIFQENNQAGQPWVKLGIRYEFAIDSTPPPESARWLRQIGEPFFVRLQGVYSFDQSHFRAWESATKLKALDLSGNPNLGDISALRNLSRSLMWLNLRNDPGITDVGLKDLPKSLTWLYIDNDPGITDAGLKDLPKSLNGLDLRFVPRITDLGLRDLPKSLTSLDLGHDPGVTDAGLKSLPKSLTLISLDNDPGITDAGLRDLPKPLTWLGLSSDHGITDGGLKDLPKSLTLLDISYNPHITDPGLKDLPKSLTSLYLAFDPEITDAGLKDLPPSLTSLEINNDPRITDPGLKDLPKSLVSLNLSYDSQITDAGLKDLPKSLTRLELVGDSHITDAGLRNLPPSVTVIR